MLVRHNSSYYRYTALYSIIWKNGSTERLNMWRDTEILYNKLHFWNRDRLRRKYRKLLFDEIIQGGKVIAIELLKDDFILISRYTYEFCDKN